MQNFGTEVYDLTIAPAQLWQILMIKEYIEKVSETVLPIYINGQCPIIKTCSDVTLNLSSKDSRTNISSATDNYTKQQKKRIFCIFGKVYKLGFKYSSNHM